MFCRVVIYCYIYCGLNKPVVKLYRIVCVLLNTRPKTRVKPSSSEQSPVTIISESMVLMNMRCCLLLNINSQVVWQIWFDDTMISLLDMVIEIHEQTHFQPARWHWGGAFGGKKCFIIFHILMRLYGHKS